MKKSLILLFATSVLALGGCDLFAKKDNFEFNEEKWEEICQNTQEFISVGENYTVALTFNKETRTLSVDHKKFTSAREHASFWTWKVVDGATTYDWYRYIAETERYTLIQNTTLLAGSDDFEANTYTSLVMMTGMATGAEFEKVKYKGNYSFETVVGEGDDAMTFTLTMKSDLSIPTKINIKFGGSTGTIKFFNVGTTAAITLPNVTPGE